MFDNVREYIDRLQTDGYSAGEDHDDDPVLIDRAGRAVHTWRENYPYDERLDQAAYDEQKYQLQVELLKFQNWTAETGSRHVLLFEADEEYEQFMAQAPLFEQVLVESGITLHKYWFSVTRSEQRTRFIIRQVDPVRQWKLSPMDLASLDKWDAYTAAKEQMLRRTDTDHEPWATIESNDKLRARIEAMQHFLSDFDYPGKDHAVVRTPDPQLVKRGRDAVGD